MAKARTVEHNFTEGPILGPLLKFAGPVLLALFLQSLYGAVDLLVVGQFATSADVSAVATGSQIMMTVTNTMTSFAMGITVLLGRQLGRGELERGGQTVGAGIALFAVIGVCLSVLFILFAPQAARFMSAPEEAYAKTVDYIRICGGGSLVIIAYNMIGSIFRGIGDSRTPFITVLIACICNIFGDLFFVRVVGIGAAGAAVATVASQVVSVILSLIMIRRMALPFAFKRSMIRFDRHLCGSITKLGLPLGTSDFLVGISFIIIQKIVNSLGLTPSAGMGVAEKVCGFIMLVPSSFMQSMAAFTAQCIGAGKQKRAIRAMKYCILVSLCAGAVMFYLAFFHGDVLCGIFSKEADVIAAGADYLKSYAIDCLLTAIFFVFVGFYNGIGLTKFVMAQGIISAFCVRVPVSYMMSKMRPVSLFHIGLATPCSSALQVVLCLLCFIYVRKHILLPENDRE